MSNLVDISSPFRPARLAAVLELLKPITWFAPMWALLCGFVSSGATLGERWGMMAATIVLAGPLVCGTSQAVNDWFDRHVDAINEPQRPIPSQRIPGRSGLHIALAWTGLSLTVAMLLGPWILAAAAMGIALAWAYSAPPFRLKRNGWVGNSAVGLCYEGLPWFTGAAAASGVFPHNPVLIVAVLYSVGAHGIMTLNDFKSIPGDRQLGIDTLPAMYGSSVAARIACAFMAVPQIGVIAVLIFIDRPIHALVVGVLLLVQCLLMVRLIAQPREQAALYNATGTSLYVLGMMVAAFALRSSAGT